MSKANKPGFEKKLKADLTQLLQVCCNKRPLVGLLRHHDKLACLLVFCFALLVSVLALLCFHMLGFALPAVSSLLVVLRA